MRCLFVGWAFAVGLGASTLHAVTITDGTGPGGVGTTDGAASGLQLWLRADSGVTQSGNLISTWADQSGHGNDVSAAGDRRPTFVSSRGTFNGQAVVDFTTPSGASDVDVLTGGFSTVPGNSARSVFIAWQPDFDANRVALDLGFGAPTGSGNFYLVTAEPALRVAGNQVFSAAVPTTTASAFSVNSPLGADVTDSVGFLDGTALTIASSSPAALNTTGVTAIGARGDQQTSTTSSYRGDIAEVVVFNTQVNAAQRQIVENYMASKYGVSITGDVYSGDTPANGDYDSDVFGVGQVSGAAQLSSGNGGFGIEAIAGLDDGEFALAGHDGTPNAIVPLDSNGPLVGRRMDRTWFLDPTGTFDATLAFDFSDAGLSLPSDAETFSLMFSPAGQPLSLMPIADGVLSGSDTVLFSNLDTSELLAGVYTLGINVQVPEPSTGLLLIGGLVFLARRSRK